MEQGTTSWHEWRSRGLGASEAPIVMGVSPWTTRLQLWEIKTGKRKPQQSNWATERGNQMEPKARASYELYHNIDMPPTLAEHKDYPFIRASLDGYNQEQSIFLEIKCPGKADHQKALQGQVPEKYFPQLMQQFIVTGAKEGHYWSFDGENGALVVVKPDEEYCQKLLSELISFWNLVQTDTPPEASDKDYELISDESLEKYCDQWKVLKSESDRINKELSELEEKIESGLQIPRGICNGLKFTKSFRKGNIDYGKIPELRGVDLEQYRKGSTEMFRIQVLKLK